jgi:arabinogalactan oligomer/maltooligosaccharide transport system substrate-binding protein
MTVKPRILLTAAATLTAVLALAGCSAGTSSSSAADSSNKTPLTVWVDADRATVLKDAAATFTKQTGVKVTLVQKDFGKIQDQFVAQVPTGKGPDITIGANDWTGNFVANGVVQPIELGDKAAGFQKVAINAMSYEGKTYGLPYSIENIAILRNTALAAEPATSYADMVSKGFLVQVGPQSDPYHLYPFQASFGAPVFGTNASGGYDPTKLELGGAQGDAFAAWLAQEGKAGVLRTSVTGDIAKQQFLAGKAPFFLTGPWNVADAEKAGIKLAVDPIPSAGGKAATPFVGVQGFFISSKTKNKLAANDFLTNYIGTEKVQTELYKVGARPPALTAAFTKASSDPIIAGFGKVGATGQPMPNVPAMGKVWQFWGVTQASIIDGKGDPAQLWQKMTSDIQAAIQK